MIFVNLSCATLNNMWFFSHILTLLTSFTAAYILYCFIFSLCISSQSKQFWCYVSFTIYLSQVFFALSRHTSRPWNQINSWLLNLNYYLLMFLVYFHLILCCLDLNNTTWFSRHYFFATTYSIVFIQTYFCSFSLPLSFLLAGFSSQWYPSR